MSFKLRYTSGVIDLALMGINYIGVTTDPSISEFPIVDGQSRTDHEDIGLRTYQVRGMIRRHISSSITQWTNLMSHIRTSEDKTVTLVYGTPEVSWGVYYVKSPSLEMPDLINGLMLSRRWRFNLLEDAYGKPVSQPKEVNPPGS